MHIAQCAGERPNSRRDEAERFGEGGRNGADNGETLPLSRASGIESCGIPVRCQCDAARAGWERGSRRVNEWTEGDKSKSPLKLRGKLCRASCSSEAIHMGRIDFQRRERAEKALGSVAENVAGPGACRACEVGHGFIPRSHELIKRMRRRGDVRVRNQLRGVCRFLLLDACKCPAIGCGPSFL